jgi:DNA-binding transcriptional regulator YdaS (Cro superfamily)
MPEFTSEQILAGISQAIAERNFDAAIAMTKLLAVQDPHAAQSIVDVVTLAASGALS